MRKLASSLLGVTVLFMATAPAFAQSNVLLLIADDLGWESVGCYGLTVHPVPTPNIDALAANGVRFTRAYVNPACSPTRACIMTGRYGFRTGVPTTLGFNDPGLNANEVLLPSALQGTNYASALIGKWHLGHAQGDLTPNVRGFPTFIGFIEGGLTDYYRWPRVVNGQMAWSTTYAPTSEVDDAITWIQAQSSPWFLTLSFCAPHYPFQAPPAHLHTRNLAGLNPATNPRPFYDAMVEALDTEIGRLLSSLSPAVRSNTNIIFVGDNGTEGMVAVPPFSPTKVKGSLYEPGSRVPLIVNGPAVAAPGRVSSAMVSSVDFFPTILDLCGIPQASIPPSPAGPLDGVSFRPLLANTATSIRNYIYADMLFSVYGGGYTIVDGTHALLRKLYNGTQQQELYRVDNDPLEDTNLLDRPLTTSDAAAYQRLQGILAGLHQDGWVENFGQPCPVPSRPSPRLRSQTMPNIGRTYVTNVVDLTAPSGLIWIAVGRSSSTSTALGPIPSPLDSLGIPGCFAYTTSEFVWMPFPNSGTGSSFQHLPIPYLPLLIGVEINVQAFVEDPQANAAHLVPTNAQHCVVGF